MTGLAHQLDWCIFQFAAVLLGKNPNFAFSVHINHTN